MPARTPEELHRLISETFSAHDVRDRQGLAWQVGVWERMSQVYRREVDKRFAPVVEHVIERAGLEPGQRVLDVGTGSGAVAPLVAPSGQVMGVDISPQMLVLTRKRAAELGLENAVLGRAGSRRYRPSTGPSTLCRPRWS